MEAHSILQENRVVAPKISLTAPLESSSSVVYYPFHRLFCCSRNGRRPNRRTEWTPTFEVASCLPQKDKKQCQPLGNRWTKRCDTNVFLVTPVILSSNSHSNGSMTDSTRL